jgi:hypothetical protein
MDTGETSGTLRHTGTSPSLARSLSLSLSLARSHSRSHSLYRSRFRSRYRSRSVALPPVMLVQGMVRAKKHELLAYFLLTRQSLVTYERF